MTMTSIALAAGMMLATLNPKSIPPTRKRVSAPAQPMAAMSPEGRQRMAEAMKRNWAERGARPKPLKPRHSQPGVPRTLPNR